MQDLALPQRLFLTGGSGYVGRNLIRHFVALGVEVVALARNDRACETVEALGAQAVQGDLLAEGMSEAMQGCQALIHAAAHTGHGLPTPAQRRVNVEGTQHILAAAREAGIRRVVHLSTESVLLDGRPLVRANESQPYPRRPAGGYSVTKAEAERIALAHNDARMEVIVLRPRFVWGRDDTTALPQLLKAVEKKRFAWVDGGRYLTSTTHIGNLMHAVERALRAGKAGEVYFITDGEPVEFRGFITALLATQGRTAPDKSVPRWLLRAIATLSTWAATTSRGNRPPPVTLQQFATSAVEVTLDISKARRELDYAPPIDREQGLQELRDRRQADTGVPASAG